MLDFLSLYWPLLLCGAVGIILLIVEMFLPGFGLPGISGSILMLVSAVLLGMRAGILPALCMVAVMVALLAAAFTIALRSAASGKLSRSPLILHEEEHPSNGFIPSGDMREFLGRVGVAQTVLRPSGIAEFDGVKLNVVSDGFYIPQGTSVRIQNVTGGKIMVRKV